MNLERQEQARLHLARAAASFKAGLTGTAAEHLRLSLGFDPGSAEARLLEARIELERQDPEAALRALDAHDLYHPTGGVLPAVRHLRAQALAGVGKLELALRLAAELSREFVDDVRPHRLASELAIRLGVPAKAAEHLRHVVRLNPGDAHARRTLAELLAPDQPQQAIDLLESLHDQPSARLRRARLLRRVGREREALEQLESLATESPESRPVWLELGTLADEMGATALALRSLDRATRLGTDRRSQVAAALTLMHAGELARAGARWWRQARAGEAGIESWAGLLVCALAMGRTALAQRVHAFIEVHSSKAERRRAVAGLWPHAACGLAVRAAIEGRSESSSREASPLSRLLREAHRTLAQHAAEHPRRADAHYHAAVCAGALGEREASLRLVRTALSLNPNYSAATRLAEQLEPPTRRAA